MRETQSHPDVTRAIRPWNLLFFLTYAVQKGANNLEGLSKFPVRKYLKTPESEGGLGYLPDKAGAFIADSSLGWYIKALLGLLTDNLPLFGYRRKSWLILTSLLAGAAWMWVAYYGTTAQALLLGLLIVNILIAFNDVVCDGLMVETAQRFERRFALPSGTVNRPFQAAQWSGAMIAGFLASIGGGIIAQFLELKTAALISGVAPLLLAIVIAVVVKEEKVGWDWLRARKGLLAVAVIIAVGYTILWLKDITAGTAWKPFEPAVSAVLIILCLLAMVRIPRALAAPVILVFVWQALPFDTNAQFVYQYFTRHNTEFVAALADGSSLIGVLHHFMTALGFTTGGAAAGAFVELYWGSVIGAVNTLFGVVGALFFRRRFQAIPFGRLFVNCLVMQAAVIVCFLSFPLLGAASAGWLMGLMAVEGFVFMIATLAVVGYAAQQTPEYNQASIFAFFMGMYNLGQILGREQVGSRLYTVVLGQGAPSAGDPHAAMTAVVVLALIYLGVVYLLVRLMIRRGYIVSGEPPLSHRF